MSILDEKPDGNAVLALIELMGFEYVIDVAIERGFLQDYERAYLEIRRKEIESVVDMLLHDEPWLLKETHENTARESAYVRRIELKAEAFAEAWR